MEQAVLTADQKEIIKLVTGEPRLVDFYLSGGTALAAYYLAHRFSDDLDFFIFNDPDILFLKKFSETIKGRISASGLRFERLHDRNQFFFQTDSEELKIEFTKYPFHQLEKPQTNGGIKIDSLRDIAANKLMAMLDRFDPKDFVDLFFILQNKSLNEIRRDTEAKFEMKIDNIFLGGELAKARRIEALPKMIKQLTVSELKTLFSDLARSLAPQILK